MRRIARLAPVFSCLTALVACGEPVVPVTVHAPAEASFGLSIARDDLVDLLGRMGAAREVPVTKAEGTSAECAPGEVHVVLLGIDEALAPQEVALDEERCGAGRVVRLRGGGELASQWAVYDLLRALGVRFFHPEETFVPPALEWPEAELTQRSGPSFMHRSFHAHRTHPIELSAPLDWSEEDDQGVDMVGIQKRWIDWNVALKTNTVDGYDRAIVGTYADDRGFEKTTGMNLLNTQQGGNPILDPDDPRPESEQLAEAIEQRMEPDEQDRTPLHFGVSFNPSEFTEADDQVTVERLTFVSDYLSENYPEVMQWTTNHGTAAPPTEHYGVRFYDLPQFAPPALGVKTHLLMFYDLERPAHVYGNRTFEGMLAFIRQEAPVRRIQHYPESSWWLTFDLPVPLYLAPATMEARQHDIDLLQDMLSTSVEDETGVYGHHIFTSGQEWGYWMIDWCFARQSWDTGFTHDDCYVDFTSRLARGEVILDALRAAERRQVDDMRDKALVRFLVGSDDETEIALEAGIPFHPLPPHPGEVLGYDEHNANRLQTRSINILREMANDYLTWADQVGRTLPDQSEQQARYVREVRDGLEIFGLRAAHAATLYETALALREALNAGDLVAVSEAYEGVEAARAITEAAREIVERREADYRYPEALTIIGDEPGEETAVENKTIYPYRYLSRTHRMFYWTRPDDQLASLFGEGLELVRPSRRVLVDGDSLVVELLADSVSELSVAWGDGEEGDELAPHAYPGPGLYDWSLDATTSGGAVHHEDTTAVVRRRLVFEKGSLSVDYPLGASAIEGLLPGFVFGTLATGDSGEAGEHFALATISERVQERERILGDHGSIQLRARTGLSSGPADLELELKDVGVVRVYDATLEVEGEGEALRLDISGEIDTGEVIDLLVSVGGFEPEGARAMVATLLEYTPETLPEREPFLLHAEGFEAP